MKLVLNVNRKYDGFTPEACAKMISQAGFDAIDYNLYDMNFPESVLNGDDRFGKVAELKSAYAAEGLSIVQTHAPFKFDGFGDAVRMEEEFYPILVRSIENSAAFGAEHIIIHPLHHSPYLFHEQELYERNMRHYRRLLPVCKANGIKLAVENMFQRDKLRGNFIIPSTCANPYEFCRYVDDLDSEYAVACLDIGHSALYSCDISPADYIRILGGERIKTLHVHDNNLKDDQHILPFHGKIDWYSVAEALGQIRYSGDLVYEVLMNQFVGTLSGEMYPQVLRYMAGIGRHLIDKIEQAMA